MPALSGRDRLLAGFVRAVLAQPERLQRRLAGRPIRIDGQELHTEVQLILKLLGLFPRPTLEELTVTEARASRQRAARMFGGPSIPVDRVEGLEVPGSDTAMPARLYVPDGRARRLPLLVYLHGGGWVICDLDTHDNVCRMLARQAGVIVLAIDYRLAPEHRFPAAVEDAVAAFRFAVASAAELGGDPEAVAVGGDSAGGTLAAVVSQLTAAEGGPAPAFQLMVYPVMDVSSKRRSYELFRDGFYLTESDMDWFRRHYLPDESSARDPRASPLLAADFSGLPPAHIATAGFDVLRDEGEEYAHRLKEAGVPVTLRRHSGVVHGVANALGVGKVGRLVLLEAAGALQAGLAGVGASPNLHH